MNTFKKAHTPGTIKHIRQFSVAGIISFEKSISPMSSATLATIYYNSIAETEPAYVAVPIRLIIPGGTVSEMKIGQAMLLRPPANPRRNRPIARDTPVSHIYGTTDIIIRN